MSISTVKCYLVRYAITGNIEATVQGRMRPMLGTAELRLIEAQLEAHDDWMLSKHVAAFAAQSGLQVSAMTMSRAIKCLGWTRKKVGRRAGTQRGRAYRCAAKLFPQLAKKLFSRFGENESVYSRSILSTLDDIVIHSDKGEWIWSHCIIFVSNEKHTHRMQPQCHVLG
jgi:transposase